MTYFSTTISPAATVPCPNGSSTSPATVDQSWSYGVKRGADQALVGVFPDYQHANAFAQMLNASESIPRV